MTKDWGEFENCKIIDGSLELFTETNICLVEQSLSEKYGGLHIGDQITVEDYKIKKEEYSGRDISYPNWRCISSVQSGE